MPPALLDPIVLNTGSVAGFQSEPSELNSAIFNDPKLDEQFDASSSTNATSTSKKHKLQAVNMWSFARKPYRNEEKKNRKGLWKGLMHR